MTSHKCGVRANRQELQVKNKQKRNLKTYQIKTDICMIETL